MANGIVQLLIVTCGVFFFAENVTSSPRPIPEADTEVARPIPEADTEVAKPLPEADTEVDPATSIDAAEACKCAETWTSDEEAEQFLLCNNAKGCPAIPCDDDSKRWCITSKLNCTGAEESGDWMYCDDKTPVSTNGAGESIADEDNKKVEIDVVSVQEPTTENAEEEQREEEPATIVCLSDELTCDNGDTCYNQDLKCDGENDCEDGIDEKDCPAPAVLESLPETDASQEDTTSPVATITETTKKAVKWGEGETCGMVLGGEPKLCDEGLECKFDDDCMMCMMGTCQKVVADEANAVETVGTATETAKPATMDTTDFEDDPPQQEDVTIVP